MFDEIFEDVSPIGVLLGWLAGVGILLYLRKQWIGTSLEIGTGQLILFGVMLLIPAYFIMRYFANKD
jgi:hypothetical protein